MPRKKLIRHPYFPYHITNRTYNRCFYPLPKDRLWKIYCEELSIVSWFFGLRVHAFVLMDNHYHLLASAPDENIDDALRYFQSKVTQRIATENESGVTAFHTRYRWSLICERIHYLNVYRYVYQNPLRALMCQKIAEYPYSTIHGRLGYSRLEIPIFDHDFYYASNYVELIDEEQWLNDLMTPIENQKISQGIRRAKFKPGSGRKVRDGVQKGCDA